MALLFCVTKRHKWNLLAINEAIIPLVEGKMDDLDKIS